MPDERVRNKDLDTKVAEAQGWKWNPHHEWWIYKDANGADQIILGEVYTPSTDLNQAVAFAEWAVGYLKTGYDIGRYYNWIVNYRVKFAGHTLEGNSLSELICLATLKALGKE